MSSHYATGTPGENKPKLKASMLTSASSSSSSHPERTYYDDCESQHGEKGKNCLVQGTGDVIHMCEPHAKGW